MHGPSKSYVFIDNTNVFVEGQRAAGVLKGREWAPRYRLDFGSLFRFLTPPGGSVVFVDGGEAYPKLYGSEPPKLDSLWRTLEEMGVDVNVHLRSFFGKEKRVDTHLCIDVSKLIFKYKSAPDGEIVIVAGDGDYLDLIGELRDAGWPFRIVFWDVKGAKGGAARDIRALPEFVNLAPALERVGIFMAQRFAHPYGETDWSKEVLYHETERAPKTRERRIS